MAMQIFRPFGGDLVPFVEETTIVAESLDEYSLAEDTRNRIVCYYSPLDQRDHPVQPKQQYPIPCNCCIANSVVPCV